ncbi:S1C family serine protease [Clostridium sp. DJ247]|uniref:S1C family serine protease n=1 Tax=Clostridium sp. DJ247 TaxID=2726188 RepID=UPI0016233244|nr:trypsin-like peptidase domain-containing protein [Clostridium sp. DJ247]MBC2578818.1 trypsin-like serine protease [Clostridium sp. DJ247]
MGKNTKLIISVLSSILIIICGIIGAFFIHNSMSHKVSANPSKLADMDSSKSNEVKNKDLKTIIHESQKLVVSIEAETGEGTALGSGFFYDDKGDIITNSHVVGDASTVNVKMADTTIYRGTVIGKSSTTDVALVRVAELTGKEPFKIAKAKNMEVGDEVIALGSPLGLQNTVTTGIISGVNRDFNIENYAYKGVYQISAPIYPGNSGGPLLDKKTGEVLGINSAKVGKETIGFSIPINQVLSLANSWAANPSVSSTKSEVSNSKQKQSLSEQDAAYLVSYFYDSLNSQDYVTAYSLLGADWQTKTSYTDFRKGYLNTISVKVENMTISKISNGMQVVTIIDATERNGNSTKLSKYSTTYNISRENNMLKIVHGEAKGI